MTIDHLPDRSSQAREVRDQEPRAARPGGGISAAAALEPLVRSVLGRAVPVPIELWDGSSIGPLAGPGKLRVGSRDAVRHVLWSPGELGFARAYVAGDIDVDGDIFEVLRLLHQAAPRDVRVGLRAIPAALGAALRTGALGRRPVPPREEARPRGLRHSLGRDRQAVTHHYDVGNDFYEMVLGPSMTYSCARFDEPDIGLADAQSAKHDLVCRKLGLTDRRGMRLLDVGCGWGSMALHAAERYGAKVLGITLSDEQAGLARRRIEAAGLGAEVEIRVQDYRELSGEQFDAISSIGMFEHVGSSQMASYFTILRSLIGPGGRLLNHAISSAGGSRMTGRTFIGRYVFPDGELLDVGEVVLAMEKGGFELRDVESLREHYELTLRHWVANLERHWADAVREVGEARARIWRLYMAASANGFADGGISVHQVLGVADDPSGSSGMPPTRAGWV